MAIEEINAKGGVLGKELEVISRDDGANPGEAVRVAEELVTREGVAMIAGTFLSHIQPRGHERGSKESVLSCRRAADRKVPPGTTATNTRIACARRLPCRRRC